MFHPLFLGHVKLQRHTAIEREERKRIEKKEKKEKDDEEERNRLYNFVKYTLGLKHQVWKQKGEEYRIHGQWGWLWLSSTRILKKLDARQCGLRAGPKMMMVQVKNSQGLKILCVEPKVFEVMLKLKSSEPMETDLEENKENKSLEKLALQAIIPENELNEGNPPYSVQAISCIFF